MKFRASGLAWAIAIVVVLIVTMIRQKITAPVAQMVATAVEEPEDKALFSALAAGSVAVLLTLVPFSLMIAEYWKYKRQQR